MKEEQATEVRLADALRKYGWKLTTAESCTAGLLAGTFMNVPGVSSLYDEGYITYADQAKRKLLGVKKKTLKKYGAVSRQVAKQMAKGAAKESGADVAISVTGIAGPDGGTPEKPVGLVYIGCCVQGAVSVSECHFEGDRGQVRAQTVQRALEFALECMAKEFAKTVVTDYI